jgi:hypothetical protein
LSHHVFITETANCEPCTQSAGVLRTLIWQPISQRFWHWCVLSWCSTKFLLQKTINHLIHKISKSLSHAFWYMYMLILQKGRAQLDSNPQDLLDVPVTHCAVLLLMKILFYYLYYYNTRTAMHIASKQSTYTFALRQY